MPTNPIDSHVGKRLRLRRTIIGMSQESLGEALGITFQQVQKYEKGINRVGASRLYELSKILSVPVNFFFSEFEGEEAGAVGGLAEEEKDFDHDRLKSRETMSLVKAYFRIGDRNVRKKALDLIKSLADSEK